MTQPTEQDRPMSAIEDMLLKFTSGNDVAVQRAVITLDEWRATYAEYMALQARVAELEAICENVPEGCTPADARVLREANHVLADEVAQAKWHKDIAEAALTSVEKERDGLAAECSPEALTKLKADAVREWLDDVIAMLVNSHEMTTHRGMTHVAIDHLREHLPQHEANQIEREGGV